MTVKMDASMDIVWANEVEGTPSQYAFKADSAQTSLFMTVDEDNDCFLIKRDVVDGSTSMVKSLVDVKECGYLELSPNENYVYVGSEEEDIIVMLNATDFSIDKVKFIDNIDYFSYIEADSAGGQDYLLHASYLTNGKHNLVYTTIDMSVESTSIIWDANFSCTSS